MFSVKPTHDVESCNKGLTFDLNSQFSVLYCTCITYLSPVVVSSTHTWTLISFFTEIHSQCNTIQKEFLGGVEYIIEQV